MLYATPTDVNVDDVRHYLISDKGRAEVATAPIPEMGNTPSVSFLREIEDLGEGIKVDNPIMLTIEFSQDGFFGYYKPLSLYASSGTIPEIEQELKDEILDLWDWLRETEDSQLGQEPLEWKRHLAKILPS